MFSKLGKLMIVVFFFSLNPLDSLGILYTEYIPNNCIKSNSSYVAYKIVIIIRKGYWINSGVY